MKIRFVSSLTPEDENTFAPTVLKMCAALLDQLSITYTLRIETDGGRVFQHDHPLSAAEASPLPGNGAAVLGADVRN